MTAPWHLQPMVGFDIESTGPNPDTARIVTATIVEVSSSGVGQIYEWLVDPGIPIPLGASAIHGITTERAREDGDDPALAVGAITGRLRTHLGRGTPVIAFNAAYDFTVLDRESRRHQLEMFPAIPIVDPHILDKQLDRFRKGKRTLTATCERHGVKLEGAHTATGDALAAVRLAYVLAARNLTLSESTLPDLHAHQQVWRAEQAASLQSYFRRTDPTAVVNGDWPIQALPDGWTPQLVDQPEDVPA